MYDANATLAQWQKLLFANESIFLPSAQPGIQRLHLTNFAQLLYGLISIIINNIKFSQGNKVDVLSLCKMKVTQV